MTNRLTMNHIITKSIFGFLICCIFLQSCKKPEEIVVHEDSTEFSLEDQQLISDNLSNLMTSHSAAVNRLEKEDIPVFHEYINTLLTSIINTSMVETRNTFNWEVIVLQDDEMRTAFTIPGGKIFIYTGLLKMISGENELFSILAHEVYYAEKGIVIEALADQYGTLLIGDLKLGTESQGAIDIAQNIHSLSYTEQAVLDADKFTGEMICPFQYEARGLKTFLERAFDHSGEVTWLSTRPSTPERLNQIEEHASDCGEEEQTFSERYLYQMSLLP